MWDFERFCKALTDKHRANSDAMLALLKPFFALSLEFKADDIIEQDFETGRGMSAKVQARLNKDSQPSRMAVATQRYPNVDLHDSILSNSVLVDCLAKGIVDKSEIQAAVDASRFFVNVADEPAWRTVWHWSERTEPEVTTAIAKMEKQFADREFTIEGEILHVFGLRLMLSEIGAIKATKAQVVDAGKTYVDDLYKAKQIDTRPRDDYSFRYDGFGGLGIQSSETEEYRELFGYLEKMIQRAVQDTYPDKALELVELMQTDIQLFYRRLCLTNSSDSLYYDTPLLNSVSVETFLKRLLTLHPSDQHAVFMMFKSRYDHNRLTGDLADERSWAEAIKTELLKTAETSAPITAMRLRYHINYYMKAIPDGSSRCRIRKQLLLVEPGQCIPHSLTRFAIAQPSRPDRSPRRGSKVPSSPTPVDRIDRRLPC